MPRWFHLFAKCVQQLAAGLFIQRPPLSPSHSILSWGSLRIVGHCNFWYSVKVNTTMEWQKGAVNPAGMHMSWWVRHLSVAKIYQDKLNTVKKWMFALEGSLKWTQFLCKWAWHQQLIEVSSGNMVAMAFQSMCNSNAFSMNVVSRGERPLKRRKYMAQCM